jgi:hypothetical protein
MFPSSVSKNKTRNQCEAGSKHSARLELFITTGMKTSSSTKKKTTPYNEFSREAWMVVLYER